LWFEEGEIEGIAEKHRQDLRRSIGETDTLALPVDKFIEIYLPKALGSEIVLDPYADLRSTEGPNVLGSTDFHDDHLEVKIDQRVTKEAERTGQWGRYNATGAHEGGHCMLHLVIFQDDPNQESLFKSEKARKISCLQRTIEGEYTGEWWEYQANQIMANLLMPRELFLEHFVRERNAFGIRDNGELLKRRGLFDALVTYLARVFQVSKQAVKIRLRELRQTPNLRQEHFFGNDSLVRIGEVETPGL
jgi:hypothetical protein